MNRPDIKLSDDKPFFAQHGDFLRAVLLAILGAILLVLALNVTIDINLEYHKPATIQKESTV